MTLKRRETVTPEYIPPGQFRAAEPSGGNGAVIAGVLGVLAAGAIGLAAASSRGRPAARGMAGAPAPMKRKCNCGR